MADNVQPDAGEQREEPSSGLLLSVDPLQGADNYKLAGDDDSDSGKGGLLGDDKSDSDGSDSDLLGGDDDSSDASGAKTGDADASDSLLGGDSDASDASDADGSDADTADAGGDADDKMNPLGIADTNVD